MKKESLKQIHMEILDVPFWIYKILKKIFPSSFAISKYYEERIGELIEEERYDYAELFIRDAEKLFGQSTFTIKLQTRIDRIRILGD